jgi:F-type H+-transporting ATPase subunit alpha
MVSVRPDEVSAILREQLAGARSEAELEEVGTVLQIGDGVARIYGLSQVQAGELLVFENGLKTMSEQFCWGISVTSKKVQL